jgi:RNA polymerase sigma factor (sigma-70 family)
MTLLDELQRIIHARVAKVLWRRGSSHRGDHRQDLVDLIHDVLEKLFKEDGALLRSWDPALGPLAAYVGSIAENLAKSKLRKRREELSISVDDEQEPAPQSSQDPHGQVEARELYRAILDGMRARLTTPWQEQMFQMIVIDALSVDEICGKTGMKPDAVHQARTRFRKLGEDVRDRVMSDPERSRLSARKRV